MDIITLFNQSNYFIPVKSAVLYFIQWGDTDTEKQDAFLECLNITYTELLLWTGETSVRKSKGFMVEHLGLRCCPGDSQITWEEEGWAVQEEYSTELPFVIQGHRTHKIQLALNEKIYLNFVPGAYITERSNGHRGINGLEMEVYWPVRMGLLVTSDVSPD